MFGIVGADDEQVFTAGRAQLVFGHAEHLAGGRVRLDDHSIGCDEKNAVEASRKERAVRLRGDANRFTGMVRGRPRGSDQLLARLLLRSSVRAGRPTSAQPSDQPRVYASH